NYKVACNDNVEALLAEAQPAEIRPESIPLDVVYEDDHMIIINKPRGMVVHP
ncbi:MAG TPA: RluA family pseudouridine synthase, partial [Sporomusaceae bacterium]|nr:RluA family pseudouridine synthase [Sporomusaceae bacterium]